MTALITGASSGIGREIAKALAEQGHTLILVARRRERLEALRDSLPVPVRIVCADLSQDADCERLLAEVDSQQVDILVNNAGLGVFGAFAESALDRELHMLDVNIRALHRLTKAFYTAFRARSSGYILNVASAAAFLPGPLLASYYASKAYVLRLTQALREELRREGSRVYIGALCPGPVATEFDAVAGVKFCVPGMTADTVARTAVRGMFRGKAVIVPGWRMKLVHIGVRFLPDWLLVRIAYRMQKRKDREERAE